MSLTLCWNKETALEAIKTKSSDTRKIFAQKWPFFQLFFLGNIGQENVFNDTLERKNAFQNYENKKFKKSKN